MQDRIKDRVSTILALFSDCSDFDKDLVLFFLWNSEHCKYKTTYHSNEITEKIKQVAKHKSNLVYWRGKSRVYCYDTEFFTFYFSFCGNRLKSKFIFA